MPVSSAAWGARSVQSEAILRANTERPVAYRVPTSNEMPPLDNVDSAAESDRSSAGERPVRVWETRVGGVGFTLFEFPPSGGVAALRPSLPNQAVLCCALQGALTLRIGEARSPLPPRRPVVVGDSMPVLVEATSAGWGIRVYARPRQPGKPGQSGAFRLRGSVPSQSPDGEVWTKLSPLADCLECAGRAIRLGARVPEEVEASLVSALNSAAWDCSRSRREASSGTLPKCVTEAERYIHSHLAQNVNMDDLVRATGASLRTLHASFRRHRGYSPMQYLRKQRMEQVRRELAEPTGGESVTSVALKWGFAHLGRFSAYYAKQFGESPSATLQKPRTPCPRSTFHD
jgi:AraC-like DNA-binding protein